MQVKSESEDTQSCLTPSDPRDCSLPDSSVHGIYQARVLEWGAIDFSARFSLVLVKITGEYIIEIDQLILNFIQEYRNVKLPK